MEQNKCQRCGQELDPQADFCTECGAPRAIPQDYTQYSANQDPHPYQQDNQTYQQQRPPSSGMAISSMVLGIVSLVLSCIFLGWIPAIISLIQGILVLVNDKPGRGMAISGIVMSVIGLIIFIFMIVMILIGAADYSTYYNY